MWFMPLLFTPVFIIELLIVFTCCGKRGKTAFFVLVAGSIGLMFALSHNAQPNKAVWSTPTGFISHVSLRPRAILPHTMVVKVKAAAVNPVDYQTLNHLANVPFVRWVMHQSVSVDIAGVVVDSKCPHQFKMGDKVFGNGLGGTQEYAVMLCFRAGKIPSGVSFVNAAASVIVMETALSAFRALPTNADTVLIIGASGGCGLAGITLAKHHRIKNIVCVSSGKNRELVLQRGCTEVFDYTSKTFFDEITSKWQGNVDLVFDTVSAFGNNPYFPVLHKLLKHETNKYMAVEQVFDRVLVGGKPYEQYEMVFADAFPEDIAMMESNPHLFDVKLADTGGRTLDGLNASDVEWAFNQLKTRRTVGKLVFKIE